MTYIYIYIYDAILITRVSKNISGTPYYISATDGIDRAHDTSIRPSCGNDNRKHDVDLRFRIVRHRPPFPGRTRKLYTYMNGVYYVKPSKRSCVCVCVCICTFRRLKIASYYV